LTSFEELGSRKTPADIRLYKHKSRVEGAEGGAELESLEDSKGTILAGGFTRWTSLFVR
jgi:hypothetical protein